MYLVALSMIFASLILVANTILKRTLVKTTNLKGFIDEV